MSYERLKPQLSIAKEQIDELKRIVPEAFADGKINWQTLKEALGEYLEDEGAEAEHFGLFWPGKREARRMAAIPSKGTLVPVPGEGIDEETTHNIFIEGENLEVLKLLQKSYAGRVKVVYIDPPYNTGNDFIYEDDFREPLEEYLRRTRQVDEEGKPMTTNTRADGRFHSKWLSMIYPRLRVARSLLQEDGVIFASVDDNEVHNLRQIMNEIFGEENFLSQIIVQSNRRGQTYKDVAKTHEYLICYSKESDTGLNELKKEADDTQYEDQLGSYTIRELRNRNPKFGKFNRPNLFFPIYVAPTRTDRYGFSLISLQKSTDFNVEVYPFNSEGVESCWRWSSRKISNQDLTNEEKTNLVAKQKKDGKWNVYEKYRKSTYKAKTIWDEKEVISEQGTLDLKKLDMKGQFDFPKPVGLVKKLLSISSDSDDLILDFFAGSGTTAQAVAELNLNDGGNRRFILVQMPEPCNQDSEAFKNGYKNIAELCKERIRRALRVIKKEGGNGDVGFRIYRLNKSNFKIWQDYDGTNLSELEANLDLFETPLVDGWKPENLLTEILLLEGFPLDSKIEKLNNHKKNTVQRISSEFCEHHLVVCLDKKIEQETIQHLKFEENDVFVCLDSALTDQDKMRLADICKLKTI